MAELYDRLSEYDSYELPTTAREAANYLPAGPPRQDKPSKFAAEFASRLNGPDSGRPNASASRRPSGGADLASASITESRRRSEALASSLYEAPSCRQLFEDGCRRLGIETSSVAADAARRPQAQHQARRGPGRIEPTHALALGQVAPPPVAPPQQQQQVQQVQQQPPPAAAPAQQPLANDVVPFEQPQELKDDYKRLYDRWRYKTKTTTGDQWDDYHGGGGPLVQLEWKGKVYQGPSHLEEAVLQRLDEGLPVEMAFNGYPNSVATARREGRLQHRDREASILLYNDYCRSFLLGGSRHRAPKQRR